MNYSNIYMGSSKKNLSKITTMVSQSILFVLIPNPPSGFEVYEELENNTG